MLKSLAPNLILLSILLLCSCDPSVSESDSPPVRDQNAMGTETINMIFSRLPEPGVLPAQMERTGTDFDWSFLRLQDYPEPSADTVSAILSGLLTADVGYFIAFDQSDFDSPYFIKVNQISGEMCQVPRDRIEMINNDFDRNVNRRDSMQTILSSVYQRTTSSLRQGNRSNLSILFATSYVIENLFITTGLIDNYPDDLLAEDSRSLIILPLVRILLEQESILEDGIKLVSQISDTGVGSQLLTRMRSIDAYFDQLSIEEDLRERRADRIMSNDTFRALREEIARTRNIILEEIR